MLIQTVNDKKKKNFLAGRNKVKPAIQEEEAAESAGRGDGRKRDDVDDERAEETAANRRKLRFVC